MNEPAKRGTFQFGPFRVDPGERILTRDGSPLIITPKAFDLLVYLAGRAGEVVSREEILAAVWADTVVDENNLPVHISSLRRALGDSAANPRYIGTVARRGYRLLAPVHWVDGAQDEVPPVRTPAASVAPRRQSNPWPWRILAGALLTLGAVGLAFRFRRPDVAWIPVTFTYAPGTETSPALSPDGSEIVYTILNRGSFGLYRQRFGETAPTRLSNQYDYNAAWSPDGATIAFVRVGDVVELWTRSARDGTERLVRILDFDGPPPGPQLHFTAGGKWILTSEGSGMPAGLTPRHLVAISVASGEERNLLDPIPGTAGDSAPVLSSDQRRLAFCRCLSTNACDLYVAPVEGLRVTGPPQRLTDSASPEFRPVFLPDGSIVYPLGPRDSRTLRRTHFDLLGRPRSETVSRMGEDVMLPSLAVRAKGDLRLAYVQRYTDANIWAVDLDGPDGRMKGAQPVIASTRSDETPSFSPDGGRVAFASTRSGQWEIWTCAADGSDCRQVTRLGPAYSNHPSWSPSADWILFESRPTSEAHLYVVPSRGGEARQITPPGASYLEPVWSRDGRWIYFSSNRSGRFEIYRSPAAGVASGPLQFEQLTHGGGTSPSVSADGEDLLFTGPDGFVYHRSAGSPASEKLINQEAIATPVFGPGALVYAYMAQKPNGFLGRFDWREPKSEVVLPINLSRASGLARSPDGRRILYVVNDRVESDIHYVDLPRQW